MTSPRQRKKRLAIKKMKEKLEERSSVTDHRTVVVEKQATQQKLEIPKAVATQPQPVLESDTAAKQKKPKIGLIEMKPQSEIVQQVKEEVKSEVVETKQETEPKE